MFQVIHQPNFRPNRVAHLWTVLKTFQELPLPLSQLFREMANFYLSCSPEGIKILDDPDPITTTIIVDTMAVAYWLDYLILEEELAAQRERQQSWGIPE